MNLKKDFLKDTVNNLIFEIDMERKSKAEHMEKLVKNAYTIVNMKMPLSQEEFKEFVTHYFEKNSDYDYWTVILWNRKENKVIYDSQKLPDTSWNFSMDDIKSDLSSYRIITNGDVTAVFGISKSYIDKLVKASISETIRNSKFGEESYIWVTEIINYHGGKNFAIRRIHPNLPLTEGMYLSTDMTDIKGNYLYITELEGINKDGELFYSYYYKKLNSDEISEKLTYAKLYKDYNWVIAMGIYMDDLQIYIDQTNKDSKALASRLTLTLALFFIIILACSIVLLLLFEKLYYRHSKKLLESEVNHDSLTKASSRRSGTNDLNHAFKDYKRKRISPGIMMLDIDYFKSINDTYGHSVGDLVLVEIVNTIYHDIRSSDKLIRWGGDEFVVICYGLQKENALHFGEKILSVVSLLKLTADDKEINTTLSIGFSYFKETDSDFMDVINRADQALYQSKTHGRSQVNIIL